LCPRNGRGAGRAVATVRTTLDDLNDESGAELWPLRWPKPGTWMHTAPDCWSAALSSPLLDLVDTLVDNSFVPAIVERARRAIATAVPNLDAAALLNANKASWGA
jgi:hypothetical protein